MRPPKVMDIAPADLQKVFCAPDKRSTQGKRDAAVLRLLGLGLRQGEVRRLTLADFVAGPPSCVMVRTLKGGKPRTLPLSPETAGALADYLKTRGAVGLGAPLFTTTGKHGPWAPGPLTACAMGGVVARACKAAGVAGRITCHSFRHSAATWALRGGADLKTVGDLLGHRSARSVEQYVHSSAARIAAAVQSLGV